MHRTIKLSYYEILGVDKKCRLEEVKVAFREKSKQLHPDGEKYQVKNDGLSKSHWNYKSNTHSFMELKEAYDTIRNPDKRKEYDSLLFDTESKDGFLMEKGSWNNFITNKNSYGSVETGASQPRARFLPLLRAISEAYDTLKSDEKRADYDRGRGFNPNFNHQSHTKQNDFWNHHDFSKYQNPSGGYYYDKTFYYGRKEAEQNSFRGSKRYTSAEFENVWKRFNDRVNSDMHKDYERHQQEIRENLWKSYEARRTKAWQQHKEAYDRANNPFTSSKFNKKEKPLNEYNFSIDETMLAKLAAIYVVIFAAVTLFQIFFEHQIKDNKVKNNDLLKQTPQSRYGQNEHFEQIALSSQPPQMPSNESLGFPPIRQDHSMSSNFDQTKPFGMPK
uniref:J domain-containing protein n=1 Tax=Rhabditophanes sp. KR3021 TaxID=114890 RepID=A0AC35TMQ4_9BILA